MRVLSGPAVSLAWLDLSTLTLQGVSLFELGNTND